MKPPPVELTSANRRTLQKWARGGDDLATRAAIAIAYADGESVRVTAERLGQSEYVVYFWRRRFKRLGIAGLSSKMGRPRNAVKLSADERRVLLQWRDGAGSAADLPSGKRHALARRAAVILASADDEPNNAIAARLSVADGAVRRWRNRFMRSGIEGLLSEVPTGYAARSGRSIPIDVQRQILEARRKSKSKSTRAIAREIGVSQATVIRTLRRRGGARHATFSARRR